MSGEISVQNLYNPRRMKLLQPIQLRIFILVYVKLYKINIFNLKIAQKWQICEMGTELCDFDARSVYLWSHIHLAWVLAFFSFFLFF